MCRPGEDSALWPLPPLVVGRERGEERERSAATARRVHTLEDQIDLWVRSVGIPEVRHQHATRPATFLTMSPVPLAAFNVSLATCPAMSLVTIRTCPARNLSLDSNLSHYVPYPTRNLSHYLSCPAMNLFI